VACYLYIRHDAGSALKCNSSNDPPRGNLPGSSPRSRRPDCNARRKVSFSRLTELYVLVAQGFFRVVRPVGQQLYLLFRRTLETSIQETGVQQFAHCREWCRFKNSTSLTPPGCNLYRPLLHKPLVRVDRFDCEHLVVFVHNVYIVHYAVFGFLVPYFDRLVARVGTPPCKSER
jgi:hypothetical protein